MKEQSNSTNYHLDKSVVLFFLITFLASAGMFGFRLINHEPCEVVNFEMNSSDYRVGEIIRFKDKTKGAKLWQWDFGDKSEKNTKRSPYHTYDEPGQYTVRLLVNGKCDDYETFTIKEKLFVLDSTKLPIFDLPQKIKVGDTLQLTDQTKSARSWEWRFGETEQINSTERNPSYVYTDTGIMTVILIVNGDIRHASRKRIEVLPADKPKVKRPPVVVTPRRPPVVSVGVPDIPDEPEIEEEEPEEEEPEPFRAPEITENQFKYKLMQVSAKEATAKDFDPYLCGNLSMPVKVGRKNMTFLDLCEKIKGKKIRINEIQIFKKEDNCVKNIIVNYSKLSIF